MTADGMRLRGNSGGPGFGMAAVIAVLVLVLLICLVLLRAAQGAEPEGRRLRIESLAWSLEDNSITWTVQPGRLDAAGKYHPEGPVESCRLEGAEFTCGSRGEISSGWASHLDDDLYGILEHLYQLSTDVARRRSAECADCAETRTTKARRH